MTTLTGAAPTAGQSPPLDPDAVRERVAAAALTPSDPRPAGTGTVGLELERHVVDLRDPGSRVPWVRLTALLAGFAPPRGSRVTLEPGGQVELSTPPAAGVAGAVDALRTDATALDAVLAGEGLVLQSTGADPFRAPRRVNPAPRYVAMERHFASVADAHGPVMMSSTASLQVNLDAGPRHGWADRLAHLHRLLPVLVALAASSPVRGAARTGWASARQRTWRHLEPGRCRAAAASADPAAAWAEFALAAPVMFVRTDDGGFRPVAGTVPLAAWAGGSVRLGDRLPTAADVDAHLTTLWPPVRLRGFLELRVLDAVPRDWWPGLAATVATVVDDPVAADRAAAAAEPVAHAHLEAARDGLGDPRLRRAALGVLEAAASAVPDGLRPDVERWAAALTAGRSPAGLVLDRFDRSGPLACLTAEELR